MLSIIINITCLIIILIIQVTDWSKLKIFCYLKSFAVLKEMPISYNNHNPSIFYHWSTFSSVIYQFVIFRACAYEKGIEVEFNIILNINFAINYIFILFHFYIIEKSNLRQNYTARFVRIKNFPNF